MVFYLGKAYFLWAEFYLRFLNKNLQMALTWTDIFKFLFAILLPPIGVFMEVGCHTQLVINILLTILGYIPGNNSSQLIYTPLCRNNPRYIRYSEVLGLCTFFSAGANVNICRHKGHLWSPSFRPLCNHWSIQCR